MFKKIIIPVVIVFVIAIGAFAFYRRQKFQSELTTLHRGKIVEAIYALGKVKTRRNYDVKVGILTTAEKVYVREGDTVKKGAPLIKFTESSLFKAPFDGVVTLLAVDEGESAAPTMTLLRVDDLKDKYIEVSLEQQGALRVNQGQSAEIVFESLRGEKLNGKVSSLFSKNDEFLANIEVVGGLKENVLPGMTADVAIIVGQKDNALLLPVKALANGYTIALRDGKRTKIPVKIGAIDGPMAEVLDGDLKEGDQVLLGGK